MTPPVTPPSGPGGPTHLFPLPVGATVADTLRSWLGLFGHLPRLAGMPFLLLAAITVVQVLMLPPSMVVDILAGLAALVPYTLFAVAWHRLVLLGPGSSPGWSLQLEPRHWRFAGLLLALYALMYLGAGAALGVLGVVSALMQESAGGGLALSALVVVVLLMAMIAYLRLTFVFPAVAVDERFGFQDAWRVTRGCGFRLLGIFLAVGIVSALPVMVIQAVLMAMVMPDAAGADAPQTPDAGALLVPLLILQALYLPVIAASVTALSVSFRTRTGWIPGPPATT